MSVTQTEILGFIDGELEYFEKDRPRIKAAGLDTTEYEELLRRMRAAALAANARQENLKRMLKESTVEVEAAFDMLYRAGSTYLDAVIGGVGKTTIMGKNIQRIRSRIRAPRDEPAETPGGPALGSPK